MATTTNFGWTTPDDTDLVKDGAAAIRTLGSGIDTSLVDLKGGTTGQVLSKASNSDLDYSWTTPTDQTPLTTKGDLFGYSTADARIPVGADGTVLTADSAETLGVKWAAASGASFVGVSCSKSGNQSISHGVATIVTFDTEEFDTDSFHSTSTNTGRLTVPSGKAGKYLIVAKIWFAGSATGWRNGVIYKNGNPFWETYVQPNSNATAWTNVCLADLAVNDYVELSVNIDNGGSSLNLVGSNTRYTTFGMYLIGA